MSAIIFEKSGYLAHIRLNRPDKLNAVHQAMVDNIESALNDVENDDNIRAVLFSGEGRAFSSGFDINATKRLPGETESDAIRSELERAFEIIMRVWDCNKPTIAAVHGYCLGSSMEMAAVCDLTIAADDCRFGAPEVTFGSGIVCLILPWIIGFKQASEIVLLGRKDISAKQAFAMGLVNRVVPNTELMSEARALAREIASNDANAVATTRNVLRRTLEIGGLRNALNEALQMDIDVECSKTPESAEFNRIMQADGLRAALDWRASRLDNAD